MTVNLRNKPEFNNWRGKLLSFVRAAQNNVSSLYYKAQNTDDAFSVLLLRNISSV